MNQCRVALIFGGPSSEHQISFLSARTIAQALGDLGHEVIPVLVDFNCHITSLEEGEAALKGQLHECIEAQRGSTLAMLASMDFDIAWPVIHGTFGEDGQLQGMLEAIHKPYVGCDVRASALAFDKFSTKALLHACGIPVLPAFCIDSREIQSWDDFECFKCAFEDRKVYFEHSAFQLNWKAFPMFVKPNAAGSSVGCSAVANLEELYTALQSAAKLGDRVLIEPACHPREVECAVMSVEYSFAQTQQIIKVASEVGEIIPAADFYDFQDKYVDGDAGLLIPANLSDELKGQCQRLAALAFNTLAMSGFARVDFFLTPEGLFLNEINTLPGFTVISMFPKLFEASGQGLNATVQEILIEGLFQHAKRRNTLENTKEFRGHLT